MASTLTRNPSPTSARTRTRTVRTHPGPARPGSSHPGHARPATAQAGHRHRPRVPRPVTSGFVTTRRYLFTPPPPAPLTPAAAAPPTPPRSGDPLPAAASAPEPQGVPHFDPVRVRGSKQRLRRALQRRSRVAAAGLAVGAAALAATGAGNSAGASDASDAHAQAARSTAPHVKSGGAGSRADAEPEETVSTPVRIADADTVRLLHPGDRVDVIATSLPDPSGERPEKGPEARLVASRLRIVDIPRPVGGPERDVATADDTAGGALLILAASRKTAIALEGANATSELAVTLC